MKAYEWIDAVSGIDPELVENAAKEQPRASAWKKVLPLAACFVLLVGACFAIPSLTTKPNTEPRLAAPVPNPNGSIERTPEPDVYPTHPILHPGDVGYEDPEPVVEPTSETPVNGVNAPIVEFGPDNHETVDVKPMISSYGEMDVPADLAVQNGGVHFSEPLLAAMDAYGDDATYRVLVELFHDGVQTAADSPLAEAETHRLGDLGYIVAIEKVYQDEVMISCSFTLHATYEQLQAFTASDNLGYSLLLYGEVFGDSDNLPVVYNGFVGAGD